MRFEIERETELPHSFRVESIRGKFDIRDDVVRERFEGEIDLPENWNVGVIVGNSGTGKSTIAQEVFGKRDQPIYGDIPVIMDIGRAFNIDQICDVFNKVGFSSPPSWLKPYKVLSNGEKMRVDLANAILSDTEVIVFDEFTSVVDRDVAKVCSFAVAKYIRAHNKKFVAVSCHFDILDWLEPDWVFDTNEMRFLTQRNAGADTKDPQSNSTYERQALTLGASLGNITI